MTQSNAQLPAYTMPNFILWEDLKRRASRHAPTHIAINHYCYGTKEHHQTLWVWYTPDDVKQGTPTRYAVSADDVRRIKQAYPNGVAVIYTIRRNGQPFVA